MHLYCRSAAAKGDLLKYYDKLPKTQPASRFVFKQFEGFYLLSPHTDDTKKKTLLNKHRSCKHFEICHALHRVLSLKLSLLVDKTSPGCLLLALDATCSSAQTKRKKKKQTNTPQKYLGVKYHMGGCLSRVN